VGDLAVQVRTNLPGQPSYDVRRAAYDLKKLRGKGLVARLGMSRRYNVPPRALRMVAALVLLREKVIRRILAGAGTPKMGRKPKNWSPIDAHYEIIRQNLSLILNQAPKHLTPESAARKIGERERPGEDIKSGSPQGSGKRSMIGICRFAVCHTAAYPRETRRHPTPYYDFDVTTRGTLNLRIAGETSVLNRLSLLPAPAYCTGTARISCLVVRGTSTVICFSNERWSHFVTRLF
jgi:hypothetical protein